MLKTASTVLHKIAATPQIGIRASPNSWKNPMTSVPADDEANLRAGRPHVKKNMSVPHTTAVLRMPRRDIAPIQWFIMPPPFLPSCSNCMDQQEAGDYHHRAGDAMNGERCRLPPARPQNVGHVAKGDDGESKENNAHRPAIRGQHRGQHDQSGSDVANAFQAEPGTSVGIGCRRLQTKRS